MTRGTNARWIATRAVWRLSIALAVLGPLPAYGQESLPPSAGAPVASTGASAAGNRPERAAHAAAAQPDAPPEPDGYRMEDYRSPTPATLKGAKVVGTGDALALWREGSSAFIDVLPRPPKPQNLPPGTIWRDTPHDSLPGAIWLPNTGYGAS